MISGTQNPEKIFHQSFLICPPQLQANKLINYFVFDNSYSRNKRWPFLRLSVHCIMPRKIRSKWVYIFWQRLIRVVLN